MERFKAILNKKKWSIILMLFVLIQPLIDLDYLWYGLFEEWGIPRFSTVVRFVILPLLILWSFAMQEKNKKKTLMAGIFYGAALLVYYILHSIQAQALYDVMGFTTNFKFSWYQELVYILTLVLPLGLTYCLTILKPTEKMMKIMVVATSLITAVPIFVSNLFVFGRSTYYSDGVANFFVWFTENEFHPRQLATKFYFSEGNTIGILLFMVLPLLYYFFTRAQSKKEKIALGGLIAVHSMSMQILGTRVATYGAVLIPAYFIVLYLIDVLLKNQRLNRINLITPIVFALLFGWILPYTPAVVNQKLDAVNDLAIIRSEVSDEISKTISEKELLVPGSVEFNQFYIYMFEEYGLRAGYINTVSKEYYIDYYNYQFDPIFWMNVVEMDVYDRVNGRQIQTVFMKYKLENLQPTDHLLGAGYSTFMNGSIILEQDFIQQWMTLGIIGFALTLFPWIVLVGIFFFQLFKNWKKNFRLEVLVYGASLISGFGVAVVSGHTMDQFMTSTWIAFLTAILINQLIIDKVADK